MSRALRVQALQRRARLLLEVATRAAERPPGPARVTPRKSRRR